MVCSPRNANAVEKMVEPGITLQAVKFGRIPEKDKEACAFPESLPQLLDSLVMLTELSVNPCKINCADSSYYGARP